MRTGMSILAVLSVLLGLFPVEFLKILDRVSSGITGLSILDDIRGRFMLLYYPVDIQGSAALPAVFLVLPLVLAAAAAVVAIALGGRSRVRKYGTWDCGFKAINSRMQYTATGFSKPFRIVFRMLYKPGRELKVEEGGSPYHPASMRYTVSTEKIFEKYLYYPLLSFFRKLSRRTKFAVQTGSVHIYLVYIFAAVIILMLYNSLSS